MMIPIAIAGATGRMGRELIKATMDETRCQLAVATCRKGSPFHGMDPGMMIGAENAGIKLTDSLESEITNADVIIDFTTPETTLQLLSLCRNHNKALVTGTTGFSEADKHLILQASKEVPVVLSPNMSPGVNLMFSLIAQAARALGDQCDVEIMEKHHRNKLDAPSGTALKMGEIIAETLNRSMSDCAVYGRHGREKAPRSKETIGFSTIRGGDIIGEHTALFAGSGEQLEITHKSSSRANYARGAVQAALWLQDKPAGLYSMTDVMDKNE